MKKLLNGLELAGFIKERQAHNIRRIKAELKLLPKLAIIRTNPDPVVDSYMRLKQAYGQDIGVLVEVFDIDQKQAKDLIEKLNLDKSVHGIIVQLPLPSPDQTDQILNSVSGAKDVDGLALNSPFTAPTPMAINWLISGYNIELWGKQILIVGQGRLVGAPLKKLWQTSGYNISTADSKTGNLKELSLQADVIVSGVGHPGLITPDMIKQDAVIIDAGVATDSNGLIGDVSVDVRDLPDVIITPEKGGVGPLTVCALFENVIRAAEKLGA